MTCGGEVLALRAMFTVDAGDEAGLGRVLDDLDCRACAEVAVVVLCRTLAGALDAADARTGYDWRDVLTTRLTLLLDAAAEVSSRD